MQYILNRLQQEYGFSDYQVKLLRFSFTGILYDVSKTLIFIVYFTYIGKFPELIFALIPLILLRTRSGGIHFRKYWTCFFFSLSVSGNPRFAGSHPVTPACGLSGSCRLCGRRLSARSQLVKGESRCTGCRFKR